MTPSKPALWERLPKWLIPAIGYTIGGLSLFWVLFKFPYAQLGEHLRTLDWRWVGVAIAMECGIYFVEAWRWKRILHPTGAPSFALCVQAIWVGLFANVLLPARAGEAIRCFLLSYKTGIPLSITITSDLIMRLMDGVCVVILYLMVTWQVSSHVAVNRVMWIFGGTMVALAAVLLWALFRRQHAHAFLNNRSWTAHFAHLLERIHHLGHWDELGRAMALSVPYWILQVGALWAIARADAFDYPFAAMAFLVVVKSVGTLMPSAPANMGAFQAIVIYGLQRLFTEPSDARILAEIMFLLQTLPLAIGGAIAITSAGFNFKELRQHAMLAHKTGRIEDAS